MSGDVAVVAARHPSSVGDRTMPSGAVSVSVKVTARVNAGRWITDCPDPDCNGAEYVSFDSPVFFCCECRNARWGHDLLSVTVPTPKKRRDIEAYLRARPAPGTRNWRPEETVADLRDENRAKGILLLEEDR